VLGRRRELGVRGPGGLGRAALSVLAVLPVLIARPAFACLVCIAIPERTLADRLIEAEMVVLARADPARPFTYAPVERLGAGAREGQGEVGDPSIPLLIDSTTRQRLAADPEAAVLLAREASGWVPLAFVDPTTRPILDQILTLAPVWDGESYHASRFAYFARLYNHTNRTIRELALAEISRAPYALIRTMRPRVARADIARVLRDPRWREWAPIHILFLGLGEDPADHDFVRHMAELAARRGSAPDLAAWLTALVEIDGPQAVAALRRTYLENEARAVEEVRALVTALAVLAEGGDPALGPEIAATFRRLARTRPDFAGAAARQLTALADWSEADHFALILASGSIDDPATEFAITAYLGAAQTARGPVGPVARPSTALRLPP
jgi:hypothetical protein